MGYSLTAFEPMNENVYVIRKNLCLNPTINAIVFKKALGDSKKECKIYSGDINFSDGTVICDGQAPAPILSYRYNFTITMLDDYASYMKNIAAIKMDVEGNEYKVLRGGKKVFFDQPVPFFQIEFTRDDIKTFGDDPSEFLREFDRAGYHIRYPARRGYLTAEQIANVTFLPIIIDLYFIHSSIASAIPEL